MKTKPFRFSVQLEGDVLAEDLDAAELLVFRALNIIGVDDISVDVEAGIAPQADFDFDYNPMTEETVGRP